jgi:hypothetical protein
MCLAQGGREMPQFRVFVSEMAVYEMIVDAPDAESAAEIGEQRLLDSLELTDKSITCDVHTRETDTEAVEPEASAA